MKDTKKYLKDLKKSGHGDATNKTVLVLALLFLAGSITVTIDSGSKTDFQPEKVRVIDGDTVEASVNSTEVTVRLLGVDSPETQVENTPSEFGMDNNSETRNCLREVGVKATDYARDFTENNITVRTDPVSDKYGDYSRLLAYVETGNGTLNEALIREGYARVYESEFTELERYREIEEKAKRSDRGLWSCN